MAKTHSSYAPAYRRQMVELVHSGRTPVELAREFECSASTTRPRWSSVVTYRRAGKGVGWGGETGR